jgi:hypothetical protein
MTGPVDRHVVTASARDDILAYVFEEPDSDSAHKVLAIVNLNHLTSHHQRVLPRLYRLGLTSHHRIIHDVIIFFPDVAGVVTGNTIALFHIPEDLGQTRNTSSPSLLTPYWTINKSIGNLRRDGFFLGPLHKSNLDTCFLALCIDYQSYTLQISRSPSGCKLYYISDQMCGFVLERWDLEASVQGRGTCAISSNAQDESDDVLDIMLYRTNHFWRLVRYRNRLPSSPRKENQVQLVIPCQPGTDIRSIGYDEWTGTVAIQWTRTRDAGAIVQTVGTNRSAS